MAAKIKGLQQWCKKMTNGYAHVDITNFTTAWRDGMAFCAIIHRFRPDLIDYDSLSPDNVYDNCKLAFDVAEKELNIPAFLEAEDMARLKVPDKLSVITYVSQYYNFLNSLPQLGGPEVKGNVSSERNAAGSNKRPPTIDVSQGPSSKKAATDGKENVSSASSDIANKQRQTSSGDKCNLCGNRVYLLERHMEEGKLYHRSCYRHSELSPTNKIYTSSPFLSPALQSQTPPVSPSHIHSHQQTSMPTTSSIFSSAGRSDHHNQLKANHLGKSESPSSTGSNVGTKHALVEPDRDDTKKSKLISGASHSSSSSSSSSSAQESEGLKKDKATAIKDKLRNLKEKYEGVRPTDVIYSKSTHSGASSTIPNKQNIESKVAGGRQGDFPLSGKESRQLEKRREELISAEKNVEKNYRVAPRNIPLIFQQKDDQNSSIPESRSSSSAVLSNSSKPQQDNVPTSCLSSSITNTPTTTKLSLTPHSTNPQKKTVGKIINLESDFSKIDKLKEGYKDDVTKSYSENVHKHNSNDSDTNNLATVPVAKLRTHKPSSPKITPQQTPKAAPRKSVAKDIKIDNTQDGQKLAHAASSFKPSDLRDDTKPDNEHCTNSTSPPPLPSTPPPPLPTTPPPPSTSSHHTSSTIIPPTAEKTFQDRKTSLQSTSHGLLKSSTPFISIASTATTKSADSKPLTAQSDLPSHKIEGISKSSNAADKKEITHSPIKSQITLATISLSSSTSHAVTATTSYFGNHHKRLSQPLVQVSSSNHKSQPLAIFAQKDEIPADEGQKEVLSGLLASLAGVRGRANSVPGINPPVPTHQTVSSNIDSSRDRTQSEITKPYISKTSGQLDWKKPEESSGDHKTSEIKAHVSNVHKLSVESEPGLLPSKPKSSSHVPEAFSVLNSLKKVNQSEYEAQSLKSNNISSHSEFKTPVKHSLRSNEKATLNTPIVMKNENNSTNKTLNGSNNRTKVSEKKSGENLEFKTLKLKSVQSEAKQEYGKSSSSSSTPVTSSDSIVKIIECEANHTPSKPPLHTSNETTTKVTNLDTKVCNDKDARSCRDHVQGKIEKDSLPPPSDQAEPKVGRLSRANSYEEDGLPDWKVALEERKRKLKQEASKLDLVPSVSSIPSGDNGEVDKVKTVNKVNVTAASKDIEQNNKSHHSSRPKSPGIKLAAKPEGPSSNVIKSREADHARKQDSLSNKTDIKVKDKKGRNKTDWKLDAEMQIAALGGFESDDNVVEEEKDTKVVKIKRVLPKTPVTEKATDINKIKHSIDPSTHTKDNISDKLISKVTSEVNDKTNNTGKEDSQPEFLLSKAKLKPCTDSAISSAHHHHRTQEGKKKNEKGHSDSSDKTLSNKQPKEDFRDKLNNLKHVQSTAEEKKTPVSISSTSSCLEEAANHQIKSPTRRAPPPPRLLTKPVSLNVNTPDGKAGETVDGEIKTKDFNIPSLDKKAAINTGKDSSHLVVSGTKSYNAIEKSSEPAVIKTNKHSSNLNNNNATKDMNNVKPVMETVTIKVTDVQDKNKKAVDFSDQKHSTPNKDAHDKDNTPKTKKKISIFGRKKKDKNIISSPAESPIYGKKKIEVPVQFDFDKSIDFETSLNDATAKLSVNDNESVQTTPHREQDNTNSVLSPGHISAIELQQQLLDIDSRLTDLELRGRDLEDSIRNVNVLEDDDDSLMIKWFELISEKNDLVRQEADLVYMSREQDLETEQEHIESQLRYLMNKTDESKSEAENEEEDYLIHRKIELVEQRNRIVDSMDEDRLRYEEEDRDIEETLRDKGLWKDSSGTLKAEKGKKVAKSTFYT